MTRIPKDVDKLMWLVADDGSPEALADFESRFPDFREELRKRIEMVGSLRGARPDRSAYTLPRFVAPRTAPQPAGFRLRWAIAGVGLAGLAAASFFAARSLSGPKAQQSGPKVSVRSTAATTVPPPGPRDSGDMRGFAVPPAEDVSPLRDAPDPGLGEPLTLTGKAVPLLDAIRQVAQKSGITLEVAPGMPNPKIDFEYRGLSGWQILRDMGPRFGFTPFDQGDGNVLIVPALDTSASASEDSPETRPVSPSAPPPQPTSDGSDRNAPN